jgi:hypothetical protein
MCSEGSRGQSAFATVARPAAQLIRTIPIAPLPRLRRFERSRTLILKGGHAPGEIFGPAAFFLGSTMGYRRIYCLFF